MPVRRSLTLPTDWGELVQVHFRPVKLLARACTGVHFLRCCLFALMKLPNAHLATVPIDKIVGYLLSLTRPRGKSKATFFRNLGFDGSAPESLATELTRHAMENDGPTNSGGCSS